MVFSSNLFVFGFMPIFFVAYYLTPWHAKNALVLLASLLFYEFGAGPIVFVLILSIILNYAAARAIEAVRHGLNALIFWLAVAANLGALFYYKYFDFVWHALDSSTSGALTRHGFAAPKIMLPIGISFFTFQALSYIADVYTGHTRAEPSILRFGMYHSLFPQLIAGPIVRYVEIRNEIAARAIGLTELTEGLTRFAIGLAKKVIIADQVGHIADAVFGLGAAQLTPMLAWLGAVAYGIQILFDFSGYSDMAIGLGRLLGFHFPENFADPYRSHSMTEFWRRWHMTLARWFRDYLYIPLGGNRKGAVRTYVNLALVFALCGLWHGAAYQFVVWGLFHGAFLASERFALHRWKAQPRGHAGQIYTLVVVILGWVLFRAADLTQAGAFLGQMLFVGGHAETWADVRRILPADQGCYLLLGIILAIFPVQRVFQLEGLGNAGLALKRLATILLFVIAAAAMSEGTFNPFIYFRF